MTTELDLAQTKLCACGNLRRAMRAVTQLYDDALRPIGLRVTQLTPLILIARRGPVPMSQLAEHLGMDRTTLTRTLAPLQREGVISIVPGDDQRIRMVVITERGRALLAKALPLWEQAQSRIINGLGPEHFGDFLAQLRVIESLAR